MLTSVSVFLAESVNIILREAKGMIRVSMYPRSGFGRAAMKDDVTIVKTVTLKS